MSFYERVVDGIAADMFGPPGSDKSAPDISDQRDMAWRALEEVCGLIDRAGAQPLNGGPEVPLEEIAGIIARQLGGVEHDEEWVSRSRTAASHLWEKVAAWLALQPRGGEGSVPAGTHELLWRPDPRIHPAYLEAAKAVVDFHFGLLADRISLKPEGMSAAALRERGEGFVHWERLDDEQRARVEGLMLDRVRTLDVEAWLKRYPDPEKPERAWRFLGMLQMRAIGLEREEVFPSRVSALAGRLVWQGSLTLEEIISLFGPVMARSARPTKIKKGPDGSAESILAVKRTSIYPCCGGEARFQVPLRYRWGRVDHWFQRTCPQCGQPFMINFWMEQPRAGRFHESCDWRPGRKAWWLPQDEGGYSLRGGSRR